MPIRSLLESDTETFESGPYQRAVRIRKWLYAFSGLVLIFAQGWFAPGDLARWLGLSAVPSDILWKASSSALLYFNAQYLLVLFQLVAIYPSTLDRRFGERARARLREIEASFATLRAEGEALVEDFNQKSGELKARFAIAQKASDLREADLQKELLRELTEAHKAALETRAARSETFRQELARAKQEDHRSKPGVVSAEVTLDVLRLLPPVGVGLVVLCLQGRLPFAE